MSMINDIYKKYGIKGVIPYVVTRGSKGYDFLAERLSQGEVFYIIWLTKPELLLLSMDDRYVKAHCFSDQKEAKIFANKMIMKGYVAEAKLVEGSDVFYRLHELGVDAVVFDGTATVFVEDIGIVGQKDGFISADLPVQNARINALLCCACQERDAGKEAVSYLTAAIRLLKDGYLLVPLRTDVGRSRQKEATVNEMEIPYIEADGRTYIPMFTDTESFEYFFTANEWFRKLIGKQYCCVLDYDRIRAMVVDLSTVPIVINPGTLNCVLSRQDFIALEAFVLARESQERKENTDDEDPMPEFLK